MLFVLYVVCAAIVVFFCAVLTAEIFFRRAGFGEFPLYTISEPAGYRMRSSQRGVFRRRHSWAYDLHGMRFEAPLTSLANINVLLGDSIVEGGLGLGQSETLAYQLQAASGETVYPIACPGWALSNALSMFTSFDGWQEAKRLLLVINTDDFDTIASASNELSFPTKYPWCLTLWLARRYLYRRNLWRWPDRDIEAVSHNSAIVRAENQTRFREIAEIFRGKIIIVRYPRLNEDPRKESFFDTLKGSTKNVAMIDIDIATIWSEECYADDIHPNGLGVELLSRLLLEKVF